MAERKCGWLVSQPANHIHYQRQNNTQYDARHNRKIERRMAAAINNVSRKAADWKMSTSEENQGHSGKGQKGA